MTRAGFRVIIVGGGIGGLALAISLQHAGIEYTLIEKAKELDPQVGASIGILPNGARILDQLGCFDDLAEQTVEMVSTASHKEDGSLIGDVSDTLSLMRTRTGYPVIFIDRQLVLRALARRVDSHNVKLETSATAIEQHEDKAVVHCKDGTVMEADIVVGSDGVHSFVRHEMWRHAGLQGDEKLFAEDKEAMSAEYKCLFGISSKIRGLEPGQTDRTYAHGLSTLSYIGKEGRVFWFVFIKMDKVYYPPDIPKFTKKDVVDTIRANEKVCIRKDTQITLGDLYENQIVCNLVALEEARYQNWSYGRLVCMGDSIHKMTPNLGAGASAAVESAAVLSNVLQNLTSKSSKPGLAAIRSAFVNYHKTRTLRVERTMAATNKLTRVQALETKKDYIFSHYVAPQFDDQYAEAFSSLVIGAPMIEYLPVPKRSLQGTMPFNPKQGWGYEESMSTRAWRAMPLIMLTILYIQQQRQQQEPSHSSWLYQLISASSPRFGLETTANQRRDFALAIHSHLIYGLWLLESTRLSNKASLVQFPLLFAFAWQYWGFGAALPLFLFFLYIQSPVEKFRASDMRLTDVSYSGSVGPLVFLFGVVPTYLIYQARAHIATSLPDWFPRSELPMLVLISVLQFVITRVIRPSTIRSDRMRVYNRDVTMIRETVGLFAALTSLAWIQFLFGWVYVLRQSGAALPSFNMSFYAVLGWDGMSMALSVSFWLMLACRDLHAAGMMKTSWLRTIVAGSAALVCLGPGSLLLLGWLWREEILLHKRHQDAVTAP